MSTYRFLLVSNSPGDYGHRVLREAVSTAGSLQLASEEEVTSQLGEQAYDVVIIDAGAVTSAPEVVERVRGLDPNTRVVVVTSSPHWKIARAVFQAGATDYLLKSLDRAEILANMLAVLEQSCTAGSGGGG